MTPSEGAVTPQERAVTERLTALQISFERYEHPPVTTVEEGEIHWAGIDATHCKNLFLRNQKSTKHYLVIVLHTKRADLRAIANQIGDGKLSFAPPEQLMEFLGVTPGSVSPFGLIHDVNRHVRVYLDRALKNVSRISFHPNVNTVTVVVRYLDFERFLAASGHSVRYVDVTSPVTGPR
jgi:Ala-tRNA(Pro) deacylase